MYLLLITQGVDHEIGLMYPNHCLKMCNDLALRTQVVTDLRLKKGLTKWYEKTGWDRRTVQWWNRKTGISNLLVTVKGVVRAYADGSDRNRWDDLYSAGMQGLATALNSFNPEKGRLKDHVRRGVRNSVINELRKIYRWSVEKSFSVMESNAKNNKSANAISGGSSDVMEGVSFEETLSQQPWHDEPALNPEEELLLKERVGLARELLTDIMTECTGREIYVIGHHILADEKETLRSIADRFNCDKSSIYRDVKRLRKVMLIEEVA